MQTFDIGLDGSLSNRRVWAPTGKYVPDGICLDANGNIWMANPLGAECVLFAPGGEILDIVQTDQPTFACMLGGKEGKTLYILTAPTSIAQLVSQTRQGHVLAAEVAVGRAGLP